MEKGLFLTTSFYSIGIVVAITFALILQPLALHVHAIPEESREVADSAKVKDQYIVVLKSDAKEGPKEAAEKAKEKGADVLHVYEHAIKGFAIKANEKALEAISNNPHVDFVEHDQVVQTFAQVLPRGINRVDGDLSSATSGNGIGTVNIDIAIIDTGVQLNHPDLYVYRHVTFVTGTTSGNDDNGHGTHVAGIAAAKDNTQGVVGMAPGARLWAVKVLDKNGSGYMSNVIKGIDYVTMNARQVDVANMSLGCQCTSSALNIALHKSVLAGVTYVVAAGNNGKDASSFSPANHPDVITVSAIVDTDGKCGGLGTTVTYGKDDTLASFSNYGSVVDVAAPGVSILSTWKGSTYATASGTSMASPHVAGAAALFNSANPSASPADIKSALQSAGSKPSTNCDGKGKGYFAGDKDAYREPLLYVRTM
jgi:subtilisin family serine protease